jgi:hypothetical protein
MLYFVVQKGDQTWAGWLAYAVLCCAMLLRWNGTHELIGRRITENLHGESLYLVVEPDY